MTDPNLDTVFKIARLATADKLMPHYAIMKRPVYDDGLFDHRAKDLHRVGVKMIEVSDYKAITDLLKKLVARTRPAGLFISGSARKPGDADSTGTETYPTAANDEELDGFASTLGERLADENVPSIVTAGDIGAKVGYGFLEGLEEYDPTRLTLVRRRSPEEVGPPSRRQGQILFIGDQPDLLRAAALKQVRAVVVLGGGPGTEAEATLALQMGMSVVPVARTVGAAHAIWKCMGKSLADYHIGQRPIDPEDFAALNSDDDKRAMSATIELIRGGLFLPDGDSI